MEKQLFKKILKKNLPSQNIKNIYDIFRVPIFTFN